MYQKRNHSTLLLRPHPIIILMNKVIRGLIRRIHQIQTMWLINCSHFLFSLIPHLLTFIKCVKCTNHTHDC